jgi:hypothetical protein
MPRPDDIKQIVDPKFTFFDGWDYEFGQYRWFYVAGFVEVMATANFRRRNKDLSILTEHCTAVPKDVPAHWKKVYPEEHYDGWESLSSKQIGFCVNQEPLNFAKASMACMCLDAALLKQKRAIEMFSRVQIRPAIFYIDGFKPVFEKLFTNGEHFNRQALLQHTLQERFVVFRSMADGYTVTYQTAALTLEYLQLHHPKEARALAIEWITERTARNTEKMQPADEENIVFVQGPGGQ